MAASKLFVFSIFSALLFTRITAEPPLRNDGASSAPEVVDSPLRLQLQLRLLETKVYLLESSINEKNRELRKKDERIRQMEEIIQGKSSSNAFFQSEIEAVEGKESLDAMEFTDKLHVKTNEELVKQVREDIILQNKKKDELEARARVAEQKIHELKFKVEDAHGGWLSVLHSVAVHISDFQSYIVTCWNERGRPALDVVYEKALEMEAQVKSSTQLSIETIKSKWIPGLKKQSLEIIAHLEPNIQLLAAKTVDVYHSSKSSVAPIVFKAQEMADPHIQVAKKFTKPYIARVTMVIDEATMVTRIHLANIHVTLKPYTKEVLQACRKFIKSAAFYHHEVQEMLKNNQLTQSLATIELAWLVATALLALPAVVMFKLSSAIFRRKANKRIYSSHAHHTRRKLKRAHPDK